MAVMSANDLVNMCKSIATNNKTLYVYACFGSPMTQRNKERYTNNCDYNRQPSRKKKIMAASTDTFGFDCVNLIKGILWGWNGDVNKTYGGAVYNSNGVPDTNANGMFQNYCYDKSSDFSNVQPGEFVWMNGHIGVAITNQLAVECTPIWKDGVQITAMNCNVPGYNRRDWTSHGKSKFIEYGTQPTPGFLPPRGYFTVGDSGENVSKIDDFYMTKVKGNYFGTYTKYITMGLQEKYNIQGGVDGNIGPYTLAKMKELGLSSSVKLPSRGYFTEGDSGNDVDLIDTFLATQVYGDYYGTLTKYATMALQTIGKYDGVYNDNIDGNFGPKTLSTAEYYGFHY